IHFQDDKDSAATRSYFPWPLFWSAWKWTGDRKYLDPIFDGGTTSLLAVNANTLDLLHLRQDWGARILSDERDRLTETRPRGARGPPRADNYRSSSTTHFS